jgi:hypothetical protein
VNRIALFRFQPGIGYEPAGKTQYVPSVKVMLKGTIPRTPGTRLEKYHSAAPDISLAMRGLRRLRFIRFRNIRQSVSLTNDEIPVMFSLVITGDNPDDLADCACDSDIGLAIYKY